MADQSTSGRSHLDHATSMSVCRAIGEKLLGTALPDASDVPPRFQALLAALQEQDNQKSSETGTSGVSLGQPTAAG